MKCSLCISNFLQEISSLSHSVVILYFFALITEEGFLIYPCYLWNSAFQWVYLSFSPLLFAFLLFTATCEASPDSHFPFLHFYSMGTVQFSSVAQSCPTLRPHESQHTRPPCPSPTPRVHSDSHPWSQPSSHLILCRPLLLLPPIPASIRIFSNESTLPMRWPKYWSFSFSIIPCKEIPGLISFRMDWLDLLAVQETLKSLLQHLSQSCLYVREYFPHQNLVATYNRNFQVENFMS